MTAAPVLRAVDRDADRVEEQAARRDALAMGALALAHVSDLQDAVARSDWHAASVYRRRAMAALAAVDLPA